MKSLLQYSDISSNISKAVAKNLGNHLWYLSEELVGLAFFYDQVSREVKRKIFHALNENDDQEDPSKRATVDFHSIPKKGLADFFTKQTKFFSQAEVDG